MKKEVVRVETYEQNEYVYSNIKFNTFNEWRGHKRFIIINDRNIGGYFLLESNVIDDGYKIISFNEFKSRYEPKLKIGDTLEYNGFVCEVKEKIEEKKWYYNTRTDKYVRTKHYAKHLTEITDKEFIKQLEENAR